MSRLVDDDAREYAVDPQRNVVLEASAGTGKTRVLVERYVNLLRAGIDPDHILAITFTRKAAAEMRDRVIDRLRELSRQSPSDFARWRDLKERLGDIAMSTIDAFCLSLLREFPLEADVDPGFELADATEVPRLISEALDQALRICRGVAKDDDDVALVFAQLGERRTRTGLAQLLDRRLVAPRTLGRYLREGTARPDGGRCVCGAPWTGCNRRSTTSLAEWTRCSRMARSVSRSSPCSRRISRGCAPPPTCRRSMRVRARPSSAC